MSEENVEVVRRAIAAYNRRDFDAMRALNHPDMELDWSASRGLEAGIYQGLEEVLRFYQNFLQTFEEVLIEPDRFIESGDSVIVPNSARVRGRDGIETVARSALVFEVRSGRLARICLYQETREALEAAGLSESAMSEENVELVRRLGDNFNAFMRGDLSSEAYAALCDPQIELHPAACSGPPGVHQVRGALPEHLGRTGPRAT
jgi:ketosteroid isomerase-like protein